MRSFLIYAILCLPVFFIELDDSHYASSTHPWLVMGSWGNFFVRLAVYVVVSVALNYFFQDDGADSPGAKPGVPEIPRVTASAPVPVLFGTMIIKQPNVVWYGAVTTTPYEKCS